MTFFDINKPIVRKQNQGLVQAMRKASRVSIASGQPLVHRTSIGEKFGFWTVCGGMFRGNDGRIRAMCVCFCGNMRSILVKSLCRNDTKSCGCAQIYNSDRAMAELKKIWDHIPMRRNLWDSYEQFQKWSLKNGYHLHAKLLFHNGIAVWSPKRKSRAGIGRKAKLSREK